MMVSLLVVCAVIVALLAACAQEPPEGGQPQPGLAAKYKGDAGIANDPAVVFAEDFESGDLQAIGGRWGDVSNKDGKVLALANDTPAGSHGSHSLQVTATIGENSGGHLYHTFPPGEDEVYARFYVKFAPDCDYMHHFVTIGGQRNLPRWPEGRAGIRPSGDERFTVGVEPYGYGGRYPPPGAWNFYPYWCEMKISADGRYWGNGITMPEPAAAPRDKWQCIEVHVKCNSAPDRRDGELALWVDGVPQAEVKQGTPHGQWTGMGFKVLKEGGEPFEGFLWRTDNEVKVNFLWLMVYMTEEAIRRCKTEAPNRVNRVWFDDVVLAREYVGPLAQ
jgi:hypothetical protein